MSSTKRTNIHLELPQNHKHTQRLVIDQSSVMYRAKAATRKKVRIKEKRNVDNLSGLPIG